MPGGEMGVVGSVELSIPSDTVLPIQNPQWRPVPLPLYPPRTSPSPGCRVRGWRARHSLQVRSLRHSSGERGIGEQGGTPQPNLKGMRLTHSHASRTHALSVEHGGAELLPTPCPKLHVRVLPDTGT